MVTKRRLSPEDWLKAGMDALAQFGPEGLKAESLARALETTKGSFYWHFPDVPAFQKQVLDYWQTAAGTEAPLPDQKKDAVAELHRIMQDGFGDDSQAEAALRAWARTDPTAAATVEGIDAKRLERLKALLNKVGVTNPDLARALYAARIGATQIAGGSPKANKAALDTLVDLVLALR